MSTALASTPRLLTAEEFARLPDPPDGSRQELVQGVVVVMPPPRFRNGATQGRVYFALEEFNRRHSLGWALTETGLITERGLDSVRGPNVVFWSYTRLPADVRPEVYPEVAPDLVVEVLSPGERGRKIAEKIAEYLRAGVRMVWVADEENQAVTVYRRAAEGRTLHVGAHLDGEDVLPGFVYPVAELFSKSN
jgi:Uma2 family endonuclease